MIEFTVFTPTYNRDNTLPRVYDCLKNQSYKDFIWLIVDDGSTDKTKALVDTWIREALIEIKYLYIPNSGKHNAMELAHHSVTTKYIIGLDSDDVLLPDAIETFHKHWKLIEEKGLENEIAEIRAFSVDSIEGKLVGGDFSIFNKGVKYIDLTWQEWTLKHNQGHEMIMAQNTKKLNECVDLSKYRLHSDKVKYIYESVFWSAIGRKYRTRYIKYIARIYYQDTADSLLHPKVKENKRFYEHLVGTFYFVEENMAYFWYNPIFFIKNIFVFSISGLYLKEKFTNQLKMITNNYFYYIYILFYPISYAVYFYKRFVRRLS